MPAINVARTDTFEIQRNKINEISNQVFNIAAGGSDLTTGNLKLGDGTKDTPSLSFDNDNSLGLFKENLNVLGFASGSKKVLQYSPTNIETFRDLYVIKNSLSTDGISIANTGSGYGAGTYQEIPITGGSGGGSAATVVVESFIGTILNAGGGLTSGSYTGINLTGGNPTSGTTVVNFTVPNILGTISNPGSGYQENSYLDVSFTSSGTGSGALATVVSDSTGAITNITFTSSGSGYQLGDVLSPDNSTMFYQDENDQTQTATGSGATFTISNAPSSIDTSTLLFTSKAEGYSVGDILNVPGEVTGITSSIVTQEGDISTILNITEAIALQLIVGSTLTKTSGAGTFAADTAVEAVSFDADASQWVLTVNQQPTVAGSITFTSTPPYGNPSPDFEYRIDSLGSVGSVTITNGGLGYAIGDVLSVTNSSLIQDIEYAVSSTPVEELTFSPVIALNAISAGDSVYSQGGAVGEAEVTSGSTGGTPSGSVEDVSPTSTSGNGVGGLFSLSFNESGVVEGVQVSESDAGYGYSANDTITFSGASLGANGNTTVNVVAVTDDGTGVTVREIIDDGSNITKVIVDAGGGFQDGSKVNRSGNIYPVSTVATKDKFAIDGTYTPNLTLYVGDYVKFTYPEAHPFALSEFRDGPNPPSLVTALGTTFTAGEPTAIVTSTAGILQGMSVTATGSGTVPQGTVVSSVDSATQITLSNPATTSGLSTVDYTGVEYTTGAVRENNSLRIFITDTTPTTLYYYCQVHPNMGGEDNNEAFFTIDSNNPRSFGSGLQINVNDIQGTNIFYTDAENSTVQIPSLTSSLVASFDGNFTGTLTAPNIVGSNIGASAITTIASAPDMVITATGSLTLNGASFALNDDITVDVDGNVDSSGYIKTSSFIEVDGKIHIETDTISSLAGFNIVLDPADTQVVRIPTNTSLNIPYGTTAERPTTLAESGSIRFNTESQQYEGYNATTSAWSSLGGVRDQDGNTYIKAEETVGANDNTLYFINDDLNTVKITPEFLQFVNVKKISSSNISAPLFSDWRSNLPVTVGEFLKWKNNLYEVTSAGTTGGPGAPPTHTSGTEVNGSASLEYSQIAVAPVTFEDVEEVRIDPTGSSPLVINGELRLSDNVISSDVSDILIRPNPGKKVTIDTDTTLVLPAGTDGERGTPDQGSVRFNTTALQFEGYDGTNWGSLGGVKDVDQNTYIIPETTPGANENILYFYNNNLNTVRLTETQLELDAIDTIVSFTSDELEITASLLTFDLASTTIDNTDVTKTFIHSNKLALELGLSSGLNVDPILRLEDTGDIFYNIGFGSGTYTGVKIFDSELKEFELADYLISTAKITLVKGSAEIGNVVLYDTATANGCRCTILSKNTSTGEKSMIDYNIINKSNTDIFHNEYGSLNTSEDGFTTVFDFTDQNEVRATVTLSSDHSTGNSIEFTVITHAIK